MEQLLAAAATAANNTTTFIGLLGDSLHNPTMLVAIIIQFVLGFAAGYYMAKIAKYIIALVGVFIVGALIGAWGMSGSVEDTLKSLSNNWQEMKSLTLQLVKLISTILVGPTALGFFIGLVVGVTRK